MSGLTAFTLFHTALSLVQLVSGIVVVIALMGSRSSGPWILVYLVSAIATSVTGFLFPVDKFLPSHAFGSSHWSCCCSSFSRVTPFISPARGV